MKTELQIAESIARKAHAGQFRRDGVTPYIKHPESVALGFYPEEEETKLRCVAWLHDVLEDNPKFTAQTLLNEGISQEVVDAVVALTKVEGENYDDYLKRVKLNKWACAVKLLDMAFNTNDSPTPKQKEKYCKGMLFLLS